MFCPILDTSVISIRWRIAASLAGSSFTVASDDCVQASALTSPCDAGAVYAVAQGGCCSGASCAPSAPDCASVGFAAKIAATNAKTGGAIRIFILILLDSGPELASCPELKSN